MQQAAIGATEPQTGKGDAMNFFKALIIHAACVAIVSAPVIALCFILALCSSCATVDQETRVDDDPQTMPLVVVPFK